METDNTDETTGQWVQAELRLAGLFDARMVQLFQAIAQSGSINQAAKQVGLSYKGAWQMVERVNNLSPQLLIETATGGAKGGGTRLTDAGQGFLRLFGELQGRHQAFLQELNRDLAGHPEWSWLLRRLYMKASARNQFFGRIVQIQAGDMDADIVVELKGGLGVVATLTLASMARLGLQTGAECLLLVKAPDMLLVSEFEGYRLSARNQWPGVVSRIQTGAVNSEVALSLAGGNTLAASVGKHSAEAMQLRVGMPVTAVFNSDSVVLGNMP